MKKRSPLIHLNGASLAAQWECQRRGLLQKPQPFQNCKTLSLCLINLQIQGSVTQSGLPVSYFIESAVPAHPHQCSPPPCFNAGLFFGHLAHFHCRNFPCCYFCMEWILAQEDDISILNLKLGLARGVKLGLEPDL